MDTNITPQHVNELMDSVLTLAADRLRAETAAAELSAEVERLQAEVAKLRELYSDWRETQECYERAMDDVERLKAALREIEELPFADPDDEAARIARAALEGKFPTKKICPECGQQMREDGYCDHIPF